MEAVQKPLISQGWLRAVIYFIGVSLIVYVFQIFGDTIMSKFTVGSESSDASILKFALFYTLMGVLIFLLTWLMRKLVDQRSFESLGFTWKGYSNEAGLGFFAALAILGIGTLLLVASGLLSFLAASADAVPLLLEIVFMIVVAFVEELLFRGYLLNNLMQSMNKWVALGVSALLFALFHETNPDVTVFAIANILLAGILLGLNYIFTRNLWFGIFFHFAWNYFQGPVLGYDVSGLKLSSLLQQSVLETNLWTGGAFGFEGSLLCPLLYLIAIAILGWLFIKRYAAGTPEVE